MFDDVVTVFVPVAQTTVLSLLAVPVCRAHGYDDVLPDAAEQTVQYTLLRPSDVPHGDAADGFAGVTKHHGLVIRASVPATQELLLKQAASTCNRFPWHPWCQRFTRRGCGVSRATLQETAARHKLRQQEQQSKAPRSRHTNVLQQQSQLLTPVQLVPVALHADQLFLQDLAAAIIQHNNSVLQHQQQQQQTLSQQQPLPAVPQHRQQARKQRSVPAVVLTPLLQQTVVSTAAAVLIQCSWRAHQRRLVSRVAERALLNRVARVIQRAWRAFLLRQRLKMLSVVAAAHRAAQQLRYSNLLCVSVGSRRLIDKAADRARSTAAVAAAAAAGGSGGGLFPEHRLRFVIDNEGSVLLVDTSSTAAAASNTTTTTSSSSSTEHNAATLQQHAAHAADNEDPESSSAAAVAAVRRVGFPTWLGITVPIISAAAAAKILEDQLWFEPFGRADVGKLLEIGSEVQDIIPPETVTDSAACHPADVAQMITFKSKQQAAAAAVLLAALTYDVGSQSACRLTSVLDTPLGAAYRTSAGGGYCSSTGGTAAAAAAAGSWAGSSSSSGAGMRNLVATSCSGQHDNADLVATDGANQGNSTSGEAAAAAAAMVQTSLNGSSIHSSSGGQKQAAHFLTNVPLVSIQPTETLTECVAADASLTSGPATSTSAAAGGLQFHTHLYSRLPYMQRIEAAAQAEASTTASTAAQDATNSSNADQEDLQAVDMTTAAAAAAEGDADSAFLVVNPATVLSVRNKAAYNQQVKVQQVEAMRMLLETEAATAAASAAADLEAKKQPVAAARASAAAAAAAAAAVQAAAATITEGTETAEGSPAATSCHKQQQQQQLDTMNCSSPGYWPSKTSAAAAASLALKQQQQAAAAALVAAMRQEVQAGRETMLRQVESDTAAMQAKHKLETQVLQQQLLQQEQQQQAAAATRATLLKAVRGASAVAWQQQQQMSGDFMRRCNMFSKHVKRGEVAVVRAAQQQQADAQVAQQRLLYEEAAELAHQKQQEMMEELKLRNLQDKQQLESLLSATKSVLATEQAALRAKVAAAVLQEKAMLMSVGPSGGVWGSATAAEVLREPLKMSLIGTVVMDTTSSSESTDVAQSTVDLQLT